MTTPTPAYDFAAALQEIKVCLSDKEDGAGYLFDAMKCDTGKTIRFALKFAAKVMQEPSEGMRKAWNSVQESPFNAESFTAMISQACAEITTQKD